MRRRSLFWLATACTVLLTWSCRGEPPSSTGNQAAGSHGSRPLALPDLARVDGPVRDQLQDRQATLAAVLSRPSSTDPEKAAAFGALALLLHAAEYYESAEPAYLNAQDLAPADSRWPSLLAHLHRSRGDAPRAIAALTRVLELAPADVPALVWLGRSYLDQGRAVQAEPLFVRANAAAPGTMAVLLGLGQSAIARKDFPQAIAVLEEAVRADPAAASIHSPLAMAYRELGDTARAEAHLRLWRNTEVAVPDPVRSELDLALQSGLSFELRGVRALEARDFTAAAGFFEQGIAITDETSMLGRSLRHKLGTALVLSGDLPGAVARFREVVRLAPKAGTDDPAAKAHYSLGILTASAGLGADAINHLRAAASHNPTYVEALVALADALRRAGRVAEALERYQDVARINPRSMEARFGYGMSLVRLRRYREARTWFEESVTAYPDLPDLPELKHALARLLVAAPDEGARSGARGLTLMHELLASAPERTTALGETLAMALAETGDFTRAAGVQRDVLAAASQADPADRRRMARNLSTYEGRRACREPWPDDDPIHFPGPPVDPGLRAVVRPIGPGGR